jgi:hypothetical protein
VEHRLSFLVIGQRLGTPFTLDEELNATPHTMGLDDSDDGPHRVQILGYRVVHVLALRHGKESSISIQRLLNRLDGSGSARGNGYRYARVHDRITEWQHGQRNALGHHFLFVFSPDLFVGGQFVVRQGKCSGVR